MNGPAKMNGHPPLPVHPVRRARRPGALSAAGLLLAGLLALAAPAAARSYAVSDEASFQAAVTQARPGDVIEVAQGTYADWVMEVPKSASGTREAPIVLQAARAVLSGTSRITVRGDWVVVSGFTFDGTGSPSVELFGDGDRLTASTFLRAGSRESTFGPVVVVRDGADDAEVDHCRFVGSLSISLQVRVSTDPSVPVPQRPHLHDNSFEDITRRARNGQEAIQLGQGGGTGPRLMHALVEHNTFTRADGDDEIISNKSSGNTIRYNTAIDSDGAFVLRGGNDCIVEGNLLIRTRGGIRISGRGHKVVNNVVIDPRRFGILLTLGTPHYAAAENAVIAHNTVVGGKQPIAFATFGGEMESLATGNVIVNNILVAGTRGAIVKAGKTIDLGRELSATRMENNLVWWKGGRPAKAAGAVQELGDNLVTDPRLVADATGLAIVPGPDSPALGKALAGFAQTDIHGVPRPGESGKVDIGAIQRPRADEPGQ